MVPQQFEEYFSGWGEKALPPPLGYDPAPIFHGVDHPDFGVLKLTPWRIEVASVPVESRIWYRDNP